MDSLIIQLSSQVTFMYECFYNCFKLSSSNHVSYCEFFLNTSHHCLIIVDPSNSYDLDVVYGCFSSRNLLSKHLDVTFIQGNIQYSWHKDIPTSSALLKCTMVNHHLQCLKLPSQIFIYYTTSLGLYYGQFGCNY